MCARNRQAKDDMEGKSKDPTIMDFNSLSAEIQKLILEAVEARKLAYCPYSKFAVGACLLTEDQTMYKGCNVENGVYGITCCAEKTAVVKAVSEGKQKFKAIAVVADQENVFTTPCGPCRQCLAEFGLQTTVYMTRSTLGKVMMATVEDLLPYTFKL